MMIPLVKQGIEVGIQPEIRTTYNYYKTKEGYYNLAPIVEKTFNIMGLTKYSTVYGSESDALEGMS